VEIIITILVVLSILFFKRKFKNKTKKSYIISEDKKINGLNEYSRKTKNLTFSVAGLYYRQEEYSNIRLGDKVILKREPNNKHDRYAVAIYGVKEDGKEIMIGYIKGVSNRKIGNYLEKNFAYKAHVSKRFPKYAAIDVELLWTE
jgi:hypothetical protein